MRQPGLILSIVVPLLLMGCTEPQSELRSTAPAIPTKDRPPLRIWLIEAPELERELVSRWQSASDQPIRIENLTRSETLTAGKCDADVVIYPNQLMGEFVQRDWISLLPQSILSPKSAVPVGQSNDSRTADVSQKWPARWLSAASFGGKIYAYPLGSASLVAVTRGVDVAPIQELEKLLVSPKRSTEAAMELWERFLGAMESQDRQSLNLRRAELPVRLETLTESELGLLVDRFLWVAATTDAKRRGLFDLATMRARLKQSEFAQSARVLARLASANPSTFFSEPSAAWSGAIGSPLGFAIGWPRTDAREASDEEIGTKSTRPMVLPLSHNVGLGLVASVGRGVKQSAEAAYFITWMGEPEQRETFHSLCTRIDLLSDQPDRNSIRDDFRAFQTTVSRELRLDSAELSLRFANADTYRKLLADALVRIIRQPDKAQAILSECNAAWDRATESFGPDVQRLSVERSQGYSR